MKNINLSLYHIDEYNSRILKAVIMYSRDFNKLTEDEQGIRDKYYKYLNNNGWKYMLNDFVSGFMSVYEEYPAILYNLSLFPNNRIILKYLDGNFKNSNPQSIINELNSLIEVV